MTNTSRSIFIKLAFACLIAQSSIHGAIRHQLLTNSLNLQAIRVLSGLQNKPYGKFYFNYQQKRMVSGAEIPTFYVATKTAAALLYGACGGLALWLGVKNIEQSKKDAVDRLEKLNQLGSESNNSKFSDDAKLMMARQIKNDFMGTGKEYIPSGPIVSTLVPQVVSIPAIQNPDNEIKPSCGTSSAIPEVTPVPCGSSLIPHKKIFNCGLQINFDNKTLRTCGAHLIGYDKKIIGCGTGLQKVNVATFNQGPLIAVAGVLFKNIEVPATAKTPDTHPEEFARIKGTKDLRHIKSDQVFSKDKKHEADGINGRPIPHWDVKNEKGEPIMEVAPDGTILWPHGPKGKGSSKVPGKASFRGLVLTTKIIKGLSDNSEIFEGVLDLTNESERLNNVQKIIGEKSLVEVIEETQSHVLLGAPSSLPPLVNVPASVNPVVKNNRVSTLIDHASTSNSVMPSVPRNVTQEIEKKLPAENPINVDVRADYKNNDVRNLITPHLQVPQSASMQTLTPELIKEAQQNTIVGTSIEQVKPASGSITMTIGPEKMIVTKEPNNSLQQQSKIESSKPGDKQMTLVDHFIAGMERARQEEMQAGRSKPSQINWERENARAKYGL